MVKLQTYHLSLFTVPGYFENGESKDYLIFQSICKTLTIFSGLKSTISE